MDDAPRDQAELKVSRYVVVSEPAPTGRDGRLERLVFGTRRAVLRVVAADLWDKIAARRFDDVGATVKDSLVSDEILVRAGENELSAILARNAAAARTTDMLYQVIQPTAFCQLGCHYCGQQHAKKLLSADDGARLLERIAAKLRNGSYRQLFVCWFGAEPLAGMSVIRTLSAQLQDLARRFGAAYSAKIITNGLALTPAIAEELVREHAIEAVFVTIDGTAEFHDRRRHRKSGAATFARIFDNVVHLARRDDLDVGITVRCNVDRWNAAGIAPLLRLFREQGLDKRIKFDIGPVHSWGNDAHRESLDIEDFADLEMEWLTLQHDLGFAIAPLPARKPIVCMAAEPDAELADAYGNLFNCTEVSYVPAYGEPNSYRIGTLRADVKPPSERPMASFHAEVAAGRYGCHECRMLPVCGGACPKSWQEGIAPCPAFKYNIEERLLLAYLLHLGEQLAPASERRGGRDRQPAPNNATAGMA